MKFSDITAAVHDAWQFSWPPLVACVVAYYVSVFLYPSGVAAGIARLHSALAASSRPLSDLRQVIEPFGLTTFIPFVAFVFVVAFLFLVNRVATVWSSLLPPHLSYRLDQLLFNRMGDKEKVLLCRKYPIAENFHIAYHMALDEHRAKGRGTGSSRAANYYTLHSLIKFAVAVASLTVIIAASNHEVSLVLLGKAVLLGVVAAAVWTVGLVGLLYEQEQQFLREWAAVRSDLQADALKLLEKEVTPEERVKIYDPIAARWWRLYAFDPYRVDWIKRTFFVTSRVR